MWSGGAEAVGRQVDDLDGYRMRAALAQAGADRHFLARCAPPFDSGLCGKLSVELHDLLLPGNGDPDRDSPEAGKLLFVLAHVAEIDQRLPDGVER